MQDLSCDVFVIGAGQAAELIVEQCCDKGMQVIVAEREHAGGSCVNFGCVPSKAAIESANLAALARRGAEFGIEIPTAVADYPQVL